MALCGSLCLLLTSQFFCVTARIQANWSNVNVTAFMYHVGLITQLWTAALMRNIYEWIALSSGGCRNDPVSTPLISVLTGGHSSMSALRPGSFVRRSWFYWTTHPDRLGQLHGSGDVDCQMLIREHTSSISRLWRHGAIWCRHLKTSSSYLFVNACTVCTSKQCMHLRIQCCYRLE